MKRRKSFTLLPVLVSIVVGLYQMQALNIVAVNQRGIGIQAVEPHRLSTSDLVRDIARRAQTNVRRALASVFAGLWSHPLRGPAFATIAVLAAFSADSDSVVMAASMAILPADIDGGKTLFSKGVGGRWATERMLAALRAGRSFSVAELRTADTLRKDEWKAYDAAVIQEGQLRLRGVADLMAAGLVHRIPNGLGKMMLEWEKVTDMEDAEISMDGIATGQGDRQDFELEGVPLPLIHKSFYLNIRHLIASRTLGEPLDMSGARASSRKVTETAETLLFQGTAKKFGGRSIYGYTTHPNRNTTAFGTNGNWVQVAKTPQNIFDDVLTMKKIAEADRFHGPFWLYVSGNAGYRLEEDFKANGDKSLRQRILDIDGIQKVQVVDKLPDNTVVLVQATSDVVDVVEGLPLQSMQWDVEGGMRVNFKAATILVPRVRSDAAGRSGVVHMS